ncbi:hypothetical protein [Niveispirillum cyanobacteriorum]|uniref:Uncharacterized protein n=1 Tax=Niveispirillum cyanobacteriorum TaxID=1612173 RepID=A0A2K9NFV6_9PROT|nr:hypothetical protein [Niveispirillum cyanobacteriorum]AUN31957.1 hypothetical protein C0V82_16130 [Niveispirillum cyanobacteriorum]GGE85439.1 hypothetical protein GCM10011317_48290 [Niveispirillum cyanobacteriorum]
MQESSQEAPQPGLPDAEKQELARLGMALAGIALSGIGAGLLLPAAGFILAGLLLYALPVMAWLLREKK